MELLFVLAAALAPACVLIFWIYNKDARKPEPFGQLFKAFVLGIASIFVSLCISACLNPFIEMVQVPFFRAIADAFWGAAIPEEAAKLFLLWLFLRRNKYFDEYMDGIVYAVMIGMGFAGVENVMYLFGSEDWVLVGITRALVSVPGHYAFAVLMGYFYSVAKFRNFENKLTVALIYLAPVLAHGIFDALLMVMDVMPYFSFLLMMAFFYFVYKMHKYCSKKVLELQAADCAEQR